MKYFIDTEFLEGPQEPKWLILKSRLGHWMIGKPKPTIDLISIGVIAEDGREYYAISKDFNVKEAWNRFDLVQQSGDMRNIYPEGKKVYWLRENVLMPIWRELIVLENDYLVKQKRMIGFAKDLNMDFDLKNFKYLVKKYGKTNKEIAKEIESFCLMGSAYSSMDKTIASIMYYSKLGEDERKAIDEKGLKYVFNEVPEFYAYFADYDWVVFCWLFGKMMDLPKGFPKYCKDLKQILDEKSETLSSAELSKICYPTVGHNVYSTLDSGVLKASKCTLLKGAPGFPIQDSSKSHNAIEDARWNKQLYEFLNQL
jgi:hypothetical protein